jgi:phosphatidylglycerol:prolipoprotein diacylglycerol transferase
MTYLLLYSILRFIVELFRGDTARGFLLSHISVSQGISILMFIASIAGMIILKQRGK